MKRGDLERLAMLAEECGEVVQAIGKLLRHGPDSYNPRNPGAGTNLDMLEDEIGDLLAVVDVLFAAKQIERSGVAAARESKLDRLQEWVHHQGFAVKKAIVGPVGLVEGS